MTAPLLPVDPLDAIYRSTQLDTLLRERFAQLARERIGPSCALCQLAVTVLDAITVESGGRMLICHAKCCP